MEVEKKKREHIENIVFGILLLGFIGFVYILNITYLEQGYKVVLKQVFYFSSAIILFFCVLSIPTGFLKVIVQNFHILFFVNLLLLIAGYLTPLGAKINNAMRWIRLGPLYFQSSEFLKYTTILFLLWIYQCSTLNLTSKTVLSICSIICSALLVGLAPDIGTMAQIMVVSFVILITLFPANKRVMVPLTIIFLISTLGFCIYKFSHVARRLEAFKDPTKDLLGRNYQPYQLKLSVYGSYLFGVGFGNSIQKLKYLPNSYNDFICAIIIEESGLLGLFMILFIFFYIFSNLLAYTRLCSNNITKTIFLTFLLYNFLNVVVNICVCLGIFPVKGITLPFISPGGSFILSNLLFLGLAIRVEKYEFS
ncbi:MAG: FtsW/RodA/SpoVE family cell cycle protein [Planctomycetota bacterium]